MRKFRGFKLGRKLVRIFKWVIKPRRRPTGGYRRLSGSSYGCRAKTMAKICDWGRCLKRRARSLCPSRSCTAAAAAAAPDAYTRIDSGLFEEQKPVQVPKGHLAVYVGQTHDDPHRFLVPVFYFNHPLFGELLREAEKEFGYQHPGGITIPCPVQEFENVQTRIAAGNKVSWKRR